MHLYQAPKPLEAWLCNSEKNCAELIDEHVLCVNHFSDTPRSFEARGFCTPLKPLTSEFDCEVWKNDKPVLSAVLNDGGKMHGQMMFMEDGLMIHLQVDEQQFSDLQSAVSYLYNKLHDYLSSEGYPHCWRVWNYFADINAKGEDGLDRYQQFCLGRQQAIDANDMFATGFPSATAIGSQSGDIHLYALAGTEAGQALENPKQVSAYDYPKKYSPVGPAFSRAMVVGKSLFISGTASIIGHQTQHPADVTKQLHECLNNVQALVDAGQQQAALPYYSLQQLNYLKVYIRDPHDCERVETALNKTLPDVPIVYLQGDVCREDLLVEVEAVILEANRA